MDDYVYIPDDFDFSFLYDDDDPSWMDAIKAEIEKLEGFIAEHDEMILKVYHWGTEIGVLYHYGSYIDITPTLINELAKYDLDLEAFMVNEQIYYQLIKPKQILHPKIKAGLNHRIVWSEDFQHSGLIDGHNFYYLRNSYHGDYIEIIYNYCPYCSFWSSIPKELNSYFEAIWRYIRNSDRLPLEPSLGSKVASYLPLGYKAYKAGYGDDNRSQCKVERSKKKYCYIKRFRDCEYYVSPTINHQLMSKRVDSLNKAISEALKMIDSN